MVIERDGKTYMSDTFGTDLPGHVLTEIEKYGSLDQVCEKGEYLLDITGGIYTIELYVLMDGRVVMISGVIDFDGAMHREEAEIVEAKDVPAKVKRAYDKSLECFDVEGRLERAIR